MIDRKDYMKEPKENGYRSLHLIIAIPIFLHDQKKMMSVEVQFRTLAMDWWATLEHKIRYKKDIPDSPDMEASLLHCARSSYYLDLEMEEIFKSSIRKSEPEAAWMELYPEDAVAAAERAE